MNRFYLLISAACCCLWANASQVDTVPATRVSGQVNVGVSTCYNTDQDSISLSFVTPDPRLGTNSGNVYTSAINDVSRNVRVSYGADVKVDIRSRHTLSFLLVGANDYERAIGTRSEQLRDANGQSLQTMKAEYNHPHELTHDLTAAVAYTCRLRRPGESISLSYRYGWQNEQAGVEQHVTEASGWARYESNVLEQYITTHRHHASIDYVCPVAKGHVLDFGVAYDRRDLSVRSGQEWNELPHLNSGYDHLTQYGALYARYRLRLGPVEAMARLEYQATHMQGRWHLADDILPTVSLRYHIDSVHSLSAFYTIALIRPEAHHLDTTHIEDAYTLRYGNDRVVGMHVHNVALTYLAHLPAIDCSAEVRYITSSDGFNAIWMERDNRLIYTYGNEGVRHAVSLTPRLSAHLSPSTDWRASATLMWDKRVAGAIQLANACWGIRADMSLTQQLLDASRPCGLALVARGDYAYHNTLDMYSYAGHGGSVAADVRLRYRGLNASVGYTCLFRPDVIITQGAYVGSLVYCPGATHLLAMQLSYNF